MAGIPPQDPWEALKASELRAEGLQARLDAMLGIVNTISEAIYIQDQNGRFLDVNEGAARMYGYPREFFTGQTPEALSAPGKNDSEVLARAFQKALHGEAQTIEYWGLRKNGEAFPKEVRLYPGIHLGEHVVIAVAQDISARRNAEQFQQATYKIAEAALESRDTQELFARVHAIVRDLMPAENLFFALWDHASDTVSFPYWVDALDPAPEPRRMRHGLTEYILRSGRPLLASEDLLKKLRESGEVESFGTLSLDWLGVPLRSDSGVFGALVIQSYRGGRRYTVGERDLLIFVSAQVALSIERARAQAEQRITTAAMDLAIDPVLGADATGKLVFVNQAACASLGYSREELLLLTMWDVDPQIDPKLWQDHWLSIRHAGSLREESRHRRKDGSFFPVELSHSFLAYEGREVIYTNVRDISSRKAADAALRASEEKFSRAFHTSPDAIVITRLDTGTYMDVSQGFEALTGWSREEVLGHPALELNIWADPLDRGRAMELVRTHGEYTGMEFQFCRKDGSLVPGLMSGKIMDVDGIPCVLSITRDLSDRKRAEEALRQSQKLESLGILAGGIAHDFNNLLTVVMGNLNLAQMHLPENATAQTYLANTEAAVLRATELTKQMLAYSGRGHFLVKPHDLNEVVREVAHLLAVSIPKKVRLRFDLGPGIPAIHADAAQLQQVVMNLITNASDAIGDREGTIHLATSAAFLEERELQSAYHTGSLPSGLYTILEVTDTGVGMSREVMARIFDPFFTTKAAGRGLGLSAMLGILRGHGAGLSIVSEVGRGSTFRICFPASKESPITPAPAVQEASTQPLKGRVLLVDDEDLILQTIGSALQSLGLEVITASDGLEALEQFNRARPELDLVLMDLTMPRMDGREAFQAMHDLDPSIPVLLSSGFTEQDSLHLLSGVDPAGFIQKPYQIKELRLLLHRVLGN